MSDLPILERRRIVAELLRVVFETLKERHGAEEAKSVIAESVRRSALAQAAAFAEAAPGAPAWTASLRSSPTGGQGMRCSSMWSTATRPLTRSTSLVAGTRKPTRRWGLVRSGTCCPATGMQPSARVTTRASSSREPRPSCRARRTATSGIVTTPRRRRRRVTG